MYGPQVDVAQIQDGLAIVDIRTYGYQLESSKSWFVDIRMEKMASTKDLS